MIVYSETKRGDILKVVGAGAPGTYPMGELVRVTSVEQDGVHTENSRGVRCEFVFNCGAARLEPTEWKEDFPTKKDHP
jgi:hypothetical protein